MPHGCVIYTFLCFTADGHWCTCMPKANFWYSRMLYIYIRRGVSEVARFDIRATSYEPLSVKRATMQGFTSFLYLYLREKLNHPHDYLYIG